MTDQDRHYRYIGWSFGAFFASVFVAIFTSPAMVIVGLAVLFAGLILSDMTCTICNPENKED